MKWDFLNDFQPLWHVRLLIYLNYFFFYRWAKILWMRTFSFCPFYGRPFWSLLSLLFQFPNQLSRLSFEYVLSMTFLKVGKAPQNLVWRVCDVVSPEIIEKKWWNDEKDKENSTEKHSVWKLLKMSHFDFGISTIFCSIEIDLSGNTVRPQVSKNSPN